MCIGRISIFANKKPNVMIVEIKFKKIFSFRDEAIFSFEADNNKELEFYHVVKLASRVRLLKLVAVYGANASGKGNFIKVCDFIKRFIVCILSIGERKPGLLYFYEYK